MHHLELQTSNQDAQHWEAMALRNWIETLTGQQVNVEALPQRKHTFKVLLYTTATEFEAFKGLLEQHFKVH